MKFSEDERDVFTPSYGGLFVTCEKIYLEISR